MSITLDVRSADGTVTGSVQLDPEFFEAQPNVPLMHQVVTAQLAAARAGTQSTKTRAEVAGGGAKPFKQKGTGRARQGSIRAPHYSGGGIALGPKPRSYRQRTPRKMVQLALKGALSDRASTGNVSVVDGWDFAEMKTKAAVEALGRLALEGRTMVVLSRDDEQVYKCFRNLRHVDLVLAGELSCYDVLCAENIVFTRSTLPGNSVWTEAKATSGTAKATGSTKAPAPSPASASPEQVEEA
ncbi:MAG TPA: 50S ribosomal protein L4 [Acidimicrobiales bacterium]|nr:50S ribosomal protein L4 [Acidimicrobiales bacterium]